jgi:hypothetical protein
MLTRAKRPTEPRRVMALLSRRLALATLGGAGILAATAALIAWQTASPRLDLGAEASATTTLDPPADAPSAVAEPRAAAATAPPAAGTGTDADAERALAVEVRALVAAGKIGKARSRASAYYSRFPNGPSAEELERLTGAHPTRDATGTRP